MRRLLLAGGLVAYAVGLIVTAPATLIDSAVRDASGGRLRLAQAQGTLWSGAGQLELGDAGARVGIAGLAWRVLPESLWRGRLVYEVDSDRATRRFPVAIAWSLVEIPAAEINLPAAVLGAAIPRLAPLKLSGDVTLDVARFSVRRGEAHGSAALHWRAAGSALTPVWPLGDYEARFDGTDGTVRSELRTLQGPLQLDGRGSWSRGRPPAFDATARVAPQHREQLAPLLRLVATEREGGVFALNLK